MIVVCAQELTRRRDGFTTGYGVSFCSIWNKQIEHGLLLPCLIVLVAKIVGDMTIERKRKS